MTTSACEFWSLATHGAILGLLNSSQSSFPAQYQPVTGMKIASFLHDKFETLVCRGPIPYTWSRTLSTRTPRFLVQEALYHNDAFLVVNTCTRACIYGGVLWCSRWHSSVVLPVEQTPVEISGYTTLHTALSQDKLHIFASSETLQADFTHTKCASACVAQHAADRDSPAFRYPAPTTT